LGEAVFLSYEEHLVSGYVRSMPPLRLLPLHHHISPDTRDNRRLRRRTRAPHSRVLGGFGEGADAADVASTDSELVISTFFKSVDSVEAGLVFEDLAVGGAVFIFEPF